MRHSNILHCFFLRLSASGLIKLFSILLTNVQGILTTDATVTADSVWDGGGSPDPMYANCLSGLIDGKFVPYGITPETKCCAATIPSTAYTWLNIDMGSQRVVQTVFIINREVQQATHA